MPQTASAPLIIKDCALLAIATGKVAQNLKELRDHLSTIHSDSLYYHFWGGLLVPRFEEREFANDFAAWARHQLHDKVLAERLSVVDPTRHGCFEDLRQELLEILEQRLDETEGLAWTRQDSQFEFVRCTPVVFRTGRTYDTPAQLIRGIPHLSVGSIFYHFVDARRRNPQRLDDFSLWFAECGDGAAARDLAAIDPYFTSLSDLRGAIAAAVDPCLANASNG